MFKRIAFWYLEKLIFNECAYHIVCTSCRYVNGNSECTLKKVLMGLKKNKEVSK